ncbi:hypothetical protein BUALT_Bualt12G0049000 [Buddleja alternifolia]|uniref:3'-5' exonuclease domain-containing protein n=1 Tax=Buddleja alternifolia TaxID=168488 RepID=A0AAV6WW02_9LAMI|nr:hypothetical protein BUALT_Bualt12G0049000 [Buddleja alternifolia]
MEIDITDHHSPHSSPDHTRQIYDVSFSGDTIETTVTADPEAVTRWINRIELINFDVNRVIVALNVEWRRSSAQRRNPVAVLQLCIGSECLIYQIIHAHHIPDALRHFFLHNTYTFAGVGISSSFEKLVSDYGIGGHANAVELGKQAADAYDVAELKNVGLKELASYVLSKEDVEKPRSVTMSNWDERWLTVEQVNGPLFPTARLFALLVNNIALFLEQCR